MGFLFHPQLHQSQAALLSEPDQEFQVSAERRKQRYLKVELAKTSTTFRHYIIINDVVWIWKLEFIQILRFAGKISHMCSRLDTRLSTRETGYEHRSYRLRNRDRKRPLQPIQNFRALRIMVLELFSQK